MVSRHDFSEALITIRQSGMSMYSGIYHGTHSSSDLECLKRSFDNFIGRAIDMRAEVERGEIWD